MKTEIQQKPLIALCCLVYFSSYVSRINYGAVISEIVRDWQITASQAGVVATLSFLSYGVGQLVAGILGDKIHPRVMIGVGLCLTMACNLGVAFSTNLQMLGVLWFINGGAQAMLWPPLVRIMTEKLQGENYGKGCAYVSMAASFATVFIYLVAPMFITQSGWQAIFVFSCCLCFVTLCVWLFATKNIIVKQYVKSTGKQNSISGKVLLPFIARLWPVLLAITLQGILRDGITTWMPTFMQQNLGVGVSVSIFVSAVLPVFAVISVLVTKRLYHTFKNELSLSALLWFIALLCCVVLWLVFANNAMLAVLCMAGITSAMHGINLMLISYFPARFKNTGNVAFVSGLLNAFTYVGSAISAYAIAAISDAFGWGITIITWIAVCAIGVVLCLKNKNA